MAREGGVMRKVGVALLLCPDFMLQHKRINLQIIINKHGLY